MTKTMASNPVLPEAGKKNVLITSALVSKALYEPNQ
jgi:hypothetical protein